MLNLIISVSFISRFPMYPWISVIMVDNILNAEKFEIDMILCNLDIQENIKIQKKLFQKDTSTSEMTGLDEEVLENIHEEHILSELLCQE